MTPLTALALAVWRGCKCIEDWFFATDKEPYMEPPKQYRKTIRQDPPALIRIKELGWFMPCGHHAYEWCSYKHVCLQCILEGRVAHRDMGRPQ